MIKETRPRDLVLVAKCHRKAFPNSFSSRLGQSYCEKMLEWYLSTDKAFLFHIVKNNNCIGYCGGIIHDGTLKTGSSSAMTQYSFNKAIKSIIIRPWLLFHKEMINNYKFVLRNVSVKIGFKKQKRKTNTGDKVEKEPYTGLVVIGVDANEQGKGYGSILLKEFERKSIELKVKKLRLSVKSDNHKAIKSYKRNGWKVNGGNNKAISMIKRL